MPRGYRPDIDGLRAVAVLLVLAFHLGTPGFAGGFVGVDVFFVISGYLITGIIRGELVATGHFNILRFFVKRSRRLVPALLTVTTITLVALLALHHGRAIRSGATEVLAASSFASNVLYWSQAGYFDAASETKLLLHTWSLGVEGQMYLVWPLILLVAWRYRGDRGVLAAIALLSLVSLAGNLAGVRIHQYSAIFFLTPFRVFEFGIGAALVWLQHARHPGRSVNAAIFVAGMVAILWSTHAYSGTTVFPSVNALAPCLGAAAVIYAGGTRVGWWLVGNPVAASIGRASYSIYLVHWPVLAFLRSTEIPLDSAPARLALVAIFLALGYALHFGVERRFYRRLAGAETRSSYFVPGAIATFATVAGAAAVTLLLAPTLRFNGVSADEIVQRSRDATWGNLRHLATPFATGADRKLLIVGDSQSADLVNMLLTYDPMLATRIRTFVSSKQCQIKFSDRYLKSAAFLALAGKRPAEDEKCRADARRFAADPRLREADDVLLAFAWELDAMPFLANDIARIKEINPRARVFVAGLKEMGESSIDYYEETGSIAAADLAATAERPAAVTATNRLLMGLPGTQYIDLYATICDVGGCHLFTDTGFPILHDRRHFTIEGIHYVVQQRPFREKVIAPLLREYAKVTPER